jgi:hypothetical protein
MVPPSPHFLVSADSKELRGEVASDEWRVASSRMGRIALHPGSFLKSVKTKGLEDTELGRIYGRL